MRGDDGRAGPLAKNGFEDFQLSASRFYVWSDHELWLIKALRQTRALLLRDINNMAPKSFTSSHASIQTTRPNSD